MARKEAINTFTDGMVSDLNPLNTPNTVLTDCLNGTLITYDGNEFTLQNDKGNYPLKDCKLPENYIPVGVKEYGDILYIVSYNPVDNKVQVGSYPSPQTIYSNLTEKTRDFTPVSDDSEALSKVVLSKWTTADRDKITEDLQIFYGGSKPESYKINPGDQYRLLQEGTLSDIPYEEIEFYIVDEDKKVHKIDPSEIIINKSTSDNEGFSFVKWNIPGYLAVKTRVANIDDFIVNTRKVKVQNYENISGRTNALDALKLNFQAIVSDELIKNSPTSLQDLKVKIRYSGWSSEVPDLIIEPTDVVKNVNGEWCYYWNWDALEADGNHKVIALANSIIEFTITPILVFNGQIVTFKTFEKVINFDLSAKGNVNEFKIGDGTWKWNVDDNLTLRFNTGGVQENAVFDQDLFLRCTVTRHIGVTKNPDNTYTHNYSDPIKDNNERVLNNVLLENIGAEWSVQGITEINLPIVPFPTDQSSYEADKDRLYAEDYYRVEFNFYETTLSDAEPIREPIFKNILATKLLNGNSSSRYDLLTFEDWFPKYSDFVENKYVILEGDIDYSDPTKITTEVNHEDLVGYDIWMNGTPELTKYYAFSKYSGDGNDYGVDDSLIKNGFNITATAKFPLDITYSNEVQLPVGPLWLNLSAVSYYNNLRNAENFNPYTGRDDKNGEYKPSDLEGTCTKSVHYNLKYLHDGLMLFNYSTPNVTIPEKSAYTLIADGRYDTELHKAAAGYAPDIYVKYDSKEYTFEKNDTTFYNSLIQWIISSFTGYDALFITIEMPLQTTGDKASNPANNKNHLYLSQLDFNTLNPSTSVERTYANATGTTAVTTYWAVFKIPIPDASGTTRRDTVTEKLWFVYINATDKGTAYDRFKTICDNIQHFKGEDTLYWGAFIKAITQSESPNYSVNIDLEGKIEFSTWLFNNIDMFSAGRASLNDNGCALFTVPKSSSEMYSNLPTINLTKKSVDIIYQDNYNILDNLLGNYATTITDRNALIEEQYEEYRNDVLVKQVSSLPGKDTFITDDSRYEQFVNILNKSLLCNTDFGFIIEDTYSSNVEGAPVWVYGTWWQYLRLGVNDKDLTI